MSIQPSGEGKGRASLENARRALQILDDGPHDILAKRLPGCHVAPSAREFGKHESRRVFVRACEKRAVPSLAAAQTSSSGGTGRAEQMPEFRVVPVLVFRIILVARKDERCDAGNPLVERLLLSPAKLGADRFQILLPQRLRILPRSDPVVDPVWCSENGPLPLLEFLQCEVDDSPVVIRDVDGSAVGLDLVPA